MTTWRRSPAETAHLKVIGLWEGFYGVANLVSSSPSRRCRLRRIARRSRPKIVVNARVAVDPETLADLVRNAVAEEAARVGDKATINTLQSFRPGRPVPTHRIATV